MNIKQRAYEAAKKRGFYNIKDKRLLILKTLGHIRREVIEAENAINEYIECRYTTNRTSPDCFEKELADISLICDTLAVELGIDLDKHKLEKTIYNETR